MKLFITGTDTGAGKTYVTAGLVRAARAAGLDGVGLKPLCCGSREDAELLHTAAGRALTLNEVNPVWLRAPLSPYAASMIENRLIDLDLIRETIAAARAKHASVLLEGAGGWLAPITRDYTFADLARDLGWPVLLVAANRLGALNHTLLTLEAIRARGLICAGVVLNQPARPDEEDQLAVATNCEILQTLTDAPVWELPHGGVIFAEPPWSRLFALDHPAA